MNYTNILQLLRIKDWFKNLIIFFPIIFSVKFLELNNYFDLIITFIIFSITSSIVYILNDIIDLNNDKKHPIKKSRPLASNKISIKESIYILISLVFVGLIFLNFQKTIFIHILIYLVTSCTYILFLKKIPFLELLILSSLYLIRIDTGSLVINVESTHLMLLTTLIISIFFILLKRIGELNLLKDNKFIQTRSVLNFYNITTLKNITILMIITFFILVFIYTYSTSFFLILTFPFIFMFIYRYYLIAIRSTDGENPISLILQNYFLIINIFATLFILITILIYI